MLYKENKSKEEEGNKVINKKYLLGCDWNRYRLLEEREMVREFRGRRLMIGGVGYVLVIVINNLIVLIFFINVVLL